MTDIDADHPDRFPGPPLILCRRCELALGRWDPEDPKCPRCWNLDRADFGA